MYRKQGEGYVVDDFAHEQSIVIESQKGLIVFNSCSHGGIVNIVDEVHHAFPNEQVYAVVGGFHLKGIHGRFFVCYRRGSNRHRSIVVSTGSLLYLYRTLHRTSGF